MHQESDPVYKKAWKVLKTLGFKSYVEYFKSEMYFNIKRRVLETYTKCACCDSQSTQVHFSNHKLSVLTGKVLHKIVPLCGKCYRLMWYEGDTKRTAKEAFNVSQRMLSSWFMLRAKERRKANKESKRTKGMSAAKRMDQQEKAKWANTRVEKGLNPYLYISGSEKHRSKDRMRVLAYKEAKDEPTTYYEKNLLLIKLGYDSYQAYQNSHLWRSIKRRIPASDVCALCGDRASLIHHMDYHKNTLLGNDISGLIPLCNKCHHLIEFDGTNKRTLKQAQIFANDLVWLADHPVIANLESGCCSRHSLPGWPDAPYRGSWACPDCRATSRL
jgi:hypothetical protein